MLLFFNQKSRKTFRNSCYFCFDKLINHACLHVVYSLSFFSRKDKQRQVIWFLDYTIFAFSLWPPSDICCFSEKMWYRIYPINWVRGTWYNFRASATIFSMCCYGDVLHLTCANQRDTLPISNSSNSFRLNSSLACLISDSSEQTSENDSTSWLLFLADLFRRLLKSR